MNDLILGITLFLQVRIFSNLFMQMIFVIIENLIFLQITYNKKFKKDDVGYFDCNNAKVFLPTMPSGTKLFVDWNFLTAFSVFGPK